MGDEELFEAFEDEDRSWFTISNKGLEAIADWCRLQLELGRIMPEQFAGTEETGMTSEYRIALLVWFLVREAYDNREMSLPGITDGHLFPDSWIEDDGGSQAS